MNRSYSFLLYCIFLGAILGPAGVFAQQETFDLATYTSPKGWKKQSAESAIQFTKEDTSSGAYCIITLFKAIPGIAGSKENFDAAWEATVKEMVTVSTAPEMQPAATENGWEMQSGYAPFESNGYSGTVILVTSTGFEKMVNLIIVTNTGVYEKNVTDFLGSISLKKPAAVKPANTGTKKQGQAIQQTVPASTGFGFTTTNFDDGWNSTVKEDWVEVTKGSIKVLLHYATDKIDVSSYDYATIATNTWNALVAPRYSSLSNYFVFKGTLDYERPYYISADLTENTTGKKVHVVLFKKGKSGWIEYIMENRNSFIQDFGIDITKVDYYADSKIWDPLLKMSTYNKFAVAASDLEGKWTSSFTGMQQYVNVYTGADAGMSGHSSNETYVFAAGSSYNWELKAATGFVGNMKFQGAKSKGKFSLSGNWQINFSDIEGKPKKYNAQFSCIKGGRILWIEDTGFSKVKN